VLREEQPPRSEKFDYAMKIKNEYDAVGVKTFKQYDEDIKGHQNLVRLSL
jgi:hypothetical protein